MSEKDKLNFLDGDQVEEDVIEEQPHEAEPEQEEPGAKPEAEEPLEVSPPETETERHIPLTALLDEREKRQEAMRKAEEAERRLAAYEARLRQEQQAQRKPDFFDNPEAVLQSHITRVKLEQSKFLAEKDFGADLVKEAYAYFDEHPEESQQLLNHPSPFHAAVEHYKRQKFLSEVKDPDSWREQEKARIREELMAELQQTQPSRPNAPPPTMAKATAAGRDAIAPGNAFDSLFDG